MRENKYRAWIPKEKRMGTPFTLREVANEDGTFDDDIIFLEWTGLNDKNGKEIYEGDIVKIGKDLIEEVKWVDQNNWMGDECAVNGWVNHESIYKIKPEIIGNIYKNPELLEDTK